jgi:N-acetylgalactosamine-6-sulfatase
VSHAAPHLPYQAPGDEPVYVLGQQTGWESRPVEEIRPTYAAMVAAMDSGIGRILDVLAELDLSERTLVLFLSDNGANRYGLNAPLRGGKNELWSGGVQVPAIAFWPGRISAGRVAGDLTSSLDVTPTLLELAGAPAAESEFDGMSLVPLLLDETPLEERTLYWRHVSDDGTVQEAARRGRWKLARVGPHVELFDLAADVGEQRDVSLQHPEQVETLTAALQSWWADLGHD